MLTCHLVMKYLYKNFYIISKDLLTTKQVQIVHSKKFLIAALKVYSKTFVMHIAIRKQEKIQFILVKKLRLESKNRANL